MRRKPKENNFKAVLETIRHLMNTECVVPEWIHDIILGYGDPSAARYDKYVEVQFYIFLGFLGKDKSIPLVNNYTLVSCFLGKCSINF